MNSLHSCKFDLHIVYGDCNVENLSRVTIFHNARLVNVVEPRYNLLEQFIRAVGWLLRKDEWMDFHEKPFSYEFVAEKVTAVNEKEAPG